MTKSILAFSGYLPLKRLRRHAIVAAHAWFSPGLKSQGKGTRTTCNWDEDALTMAVEAARGLPRTALDSLGAMILASTTHPFADRHNAGVLSTAIDLSPAVSTQDAGGTLRAGASALVAASRQAGSTMIVATDHRRAKPASPQELFNGDGSAAVIVGDGPGLADILGSATANADFVDHYRASGADFDYVLEERWLRDEGIAKVVPKAVASALASAGVEAGSVTHAIASGPIAKFADLVAKVCGMPATAAVDDLKDQCGYLGTAHPLLVLGHVLETAKPGSIIVLTAWGSGCDVMVMRVTANVDAGNAGSVSQCLARGVADENYYRFLAHTGNLKLDWGIRAERDNRTAQSAAWRKSQDITAFKGGRCTRCGTVQFPRSHVCVNPNCREMETQEPHGFSTCGGFIKTFTQDWLQASVDPPLCYANIQFDNGGNIFMEMTDCSDQSLAVGQRVNMAFRIKDKDERRGFHRYFWKAVPSRQPGETA